MSISLEETKTVLKSSELNEVQEFCILRYPAFISPEEFATQYQKDLAYADLSIDEILISLKKDMKILANLFIEINSLDDLDVQEFPLGEDPDDDEKDELIDALGFENGFVLHYVIYLSLLRRGSEELLKYLKWKRIPKSQKFKKQLFHIYNQINS